MARKSHGLDLSEWQRAVWSGGGGFCKVTGLCTVSFELGDGRRVRLLLDRESAQAVASGLAESLDRQDDVTLPHWLIADLIDRPTTINFQRLFYGSGATVQSSMNSGKPQSAGLPQDGHSTPPPTSSSNRGMGDG